MNNVIDTQLLEGNHLEDAEDATEVTGKPHSPNGNLLPNKSSHQRIPEMMMKSCKKKIL